MINVWMSRANVQPIGIRQRIDHEFSFSNSSSYSTWVEYFFFLFTNGRLNTVCYLIYLSKRYFGNQISMQRILQATQLGKNSEFVNSTEIYSKLATMIIT